MAMKKMTTEAILKSREAIAYKIIENLRDYGTLAGKLELSQRPCHARADSMSYPFTGVNYLRILAEGDGHGAKWQSLQEIEKAGTKVKEGAKVVYLEHWSKLSQGIHHVEGSMEPYIAVQDLVGTSVEKRREFDTIENFDKAVDFLKQAEYRISRYPFRFPGGKEDLFERIADTCRRQMEQKGEENPADKALTPRFLACMAFREYGLSLPFYDNNPMLSKDTMAFLSGSDGPRNLFHAFGRASTIFRQWREQQLEQVCDSQKTGKGEYFQGLRVTLFYSELPELIEGDKKLQLVSKEKASQGRPGFPPGTYTDEKAYALLRRMIELDKQIWEEDLGRELRRSHTKISLDYQGYHWREAVLQLGRLEFGNEETVRDALDQRVTLHPQQDIRNPDRLRLKLFRYDRSMQENTDALHKEISRLREGLGLWQKCSARLQKEEEALLSKVPEAERKIPLASTYLYVCHSIAGAPDPDRNFGILHIHTDGSRYPGLRYNRPDERGRALRHNNVIVESDQPLFQYTPAYTKSEQEDFAALQDFSLRFQEENSEWQEIQGEDAIACFLMHKYEDAALANLSHTTEQEKDKRLVFCYQGEPFKEINYAEGTGELNKSLPEGIPHLRDPLQDKTLQQAVHTWAKHHNENERDGCSLLYQKAHILWNEKERQSEDRQEERTSPVRTVGMGR